MELKLIINGVMKLAKRAKNVINMMSCRKSIFILSQILIDNAIVLYHRALSYLFVMSELLNFDSLQDFIVPETNSLLTLFLIWDQ